MIENLILLILPKVFYNFISYLVMIYGIGNDIVASARIAKIFALFQDKFLVKILTTFEHQQFNERFAKYTDNLNYNNANNLILSKKVNFIAKRFAAKEACAKALGTGIGRQFDKTNINFNNIEIFHNELGRPEIRIINNKSSMLDMMIFHLALSDEIVANQEVVIATVIIEKNTISNPK
jgi:holo-[acyl-carrier protein] synthase